MTGDPFPARPVIDAKEAAALAEACFGVRGTASELPAEVDRNFLITTEDGQHYILTVTPGGWDFEELDLQVAALEVLESTEMAGLAPTVIAAIDGERLVRRAVADGSEHWLRMVHYLEGLPLAHLSDHPPSLLEEIGGWLARLDLALMGFDHPGARRRIPWDLSRTLELADSLTGNARRIERVDDIERGWLDGVESVGITSAASTPEDLVQEIVAFFRQRNPQLEVIEEGEWEQITFRKPRSVPPSSDRPPAG